MWRESFPVAGAFDDDLVAGVGQAIQRAVAQDGVIEETQPFVTARLLVMMKLDARCRLRMSS